MLPLTDYPSLLVLLDVPRPTTDVASIHFILGPSIVIVVEPSKELGPPTPVIVPKTSDDDAGDLATLKSDEHPRTPIPLLLVA